MVKKALITKKVGGKAKKPGSIVKSTDGIKTAREMGISAQKLGLKKAKTHKGRRIIENKQAKIFENPKKSIFLKGRKSSETINTLMQELHRMRGTDMSKLFTKKSHDVACFEDASFVENIAQKYDCSLFTVGSTQKKRPHNLVMGRIFDTHILDMFEFGIDKYKSVKDIGANVTIPADLKPILMFQGEPFELSDTHRRLKNLLIDFFRIQEATEVNIAEMCRVIVFTCQGEKDPISMKHLQVEHPIDEGKSKAGTLLFDEIGPSFEMKIRREKMAAADLFKDACRVPKTRNVVKKNQDKNKFTNILGETKGKIFIQQQNLDTIALKKYRKKDLPKIEASEV